MSKLLVLGGAGFIGSNFVHFEAERYDDEIVVYDALTYAGNIFAIEDLIDKGKVRFVHADITNRQQLQKEIEKADLIVNFAAHSHVDRSIIDPTPFIQTNVLGVQTILDSLKEVGKDKRFLEIGTDEVYGSAPEHRWFSEADPIFPSNAYSASKAAGDCLVLAYVRTYGLNACISRCTNNYSAWQYPEKLVAQTIVSCLDGNKVPMHGDGEMLRDWIHVLDHCDALDRILRHGVAGQIYNIAGLCERSTKDIIAAIAKCFQKSLFDVAESIPDRPGNDRRYAVSPGKIMSSLGWRPGLSFEENIPEVINWYRTHESWWRQIMASSHYKLHARTLRGNK